MFESSEFGVSGLTDQELSDRLVALERERARLDAEWAATAVAWDRRLGWAGDGALSGRAWLAHHTHAASGVSGSRLWLARRLADLPHTAAALAAGEITADHARLLARARIDRIAAAFDAAEEWLAGVARTLGVDDFAKVIAQWLAYNDPAGAEESAEAKVERRRFHLSQTFDGMWALDGLLDPESGAIVKGAIDAIVDELWRSDNADEKAAVEAGDEMVRPTPAQRRVDGLVELSLRAMGAPADAQPPQPFFTVIADLPALQGARPGRLEFGDGTPITMAAARRMACDAAVIGAVLGPNGELLDLGRWSRYPSTAQRRALGLLHRTCSFPSCDRPFSWCQIHHIIHWADGGPTDLANLAPLCTRHHHHIHDREFAMARGPDGALEFHRPDGKPISTTTRVTATASV